MMIFLRCLTASFASLLVLFSIYQIPHGLLNKASAQELSVEQIVQEANRVAYYQGRDGRAKVFMNIKDSQGRLRRRLFTILRWDQPPKEKAFQKDPDKYCGDQKFYVYFHRPADVNKMVFMVWKHTKGDDDRWLYLPALDLVKRIAATEERTSFVGSHFFYEDVSGRNLDEDNHELVKTTKNYYLLKHTPKKPEAVEFSYYTTWIHRKTFIMVKAEYFDEKGEKYREYEALKVETIQGFPTVTKSRMKDLRTGGETTISYRDVTYNIGLPEEIFTERYLRRAPIKFIR